MSQQESLPTRTDANAGTLSMMRGMLLGIVCLALAGTGAELFLLGHYEGLWQWPPLVLISLSLIVLAWRGAGSIWRGADPWGASVWAIRGMMVLLIAGGMLGIWLHYDSNAEFELEIYPSMQGWELVWESLTGAMPALAPGSLIPLGLIGLTATYRHPAVSRHAGSTADDTRGHQTA